MGRVEYHIENHRLDMINAMETSVPANDADFLPAASMYYLTVNANQQRNLRGLPHVAVAMLTVQGLMFD